MVLFSNCNFDENQSSRMHAMSRIVLKREFIVVNGVSVGNINITNHTACLSGDAPDIIISITDTRLESFVNAIPDFVNAICYTESPTTNPTTISPSISPTPSLSKI